MHSEERTDAIALGTLLEVAPKSELLPKVVRGLMAGRIRGRWSTTQANAYALDFHEKFRSTHRLPSSKSASAEGKNAGSRDSELSVLVTGESGTTISSLFSVG